MLLQCHLRNGSKRQAPSVLFLRQGVMEERGRLQHIAMSFATWISPEFQLYIMVRLYMSKTDEKQSLISLNWNLNRENFKLNYRIHTDAIKENLIPQN